MNLDFQNGHLTPSQAIELTEEEFERYFVSSLENIEHRTELYQDYKSFIKAVKEDITPNFEVWIGGSFTSQKEFPRDIDLVIFAEFKILQEKEKEFEKLKMNHKGNPKRLDIYKVLVYPENHRDVFLYESKKIEWLNWFTSTKRNRRTNRKTSRGFIKIKYHE